MDRLLLLCAALALFLPYSAFDSAVRCGRPKDVANAFVDAGDSELLHTSLRYTCMVGYKRKAGTSTLIQCVLDHGKPVWTSTELQCIRDPALPLQTPGPEHPTVRSSQRGEEEEPTPLQQQCLCHCQRHLCHQQYPNHQRRLQWERGQPWGQPHCPPFPQTMLQLPPRSWPLPLGSRFWSLSVLWDSATGG
ncbi:interleukin-15 receptor subunit alpha-like isoform X4 [Cyrtonyx montezumae]|uniref:interleukin-15 receptor subunit alpha-like isoform X4 n=1 Tax=Cyrtonyx montezumae TaxID=9017 RepID=UPI0032D9C406